MTCDKPDSFMPNTKTRAIEGVLLWYKKEGTMIRDRSIEDFFSGLYGLKVRITIEVIQ